MPKTILFPGQGAQRIGMGADLFTRYPRLTARASDVLGYSIARLCLEGPSSQLNLTPFTQPAMYVVNALSYAKRRDEGAGRADYFAGHSLGEYNALHAAGAFDFETGLGLVQQRGALMASASEGGMVAVLDLTATELADRLAQHGLEQIDVANYNTPTQTVISGRSSDIRRATSVLQAAKVRCIPLNVSAPFHSRYMQPAQTAFARYLKDVRFRGLETPVIANSTARPYEPARIGQTLSEQIILPVRWVESVRYLTSRGPMDFDEVASGILTRLVRETMAHASAAVPMS